MSGQWTNIMNFLIYLGISLPILGIGTYLFMLTTPYKENELITGGADLADQQKVLAAQATAWDIGGKILGLSVVFPVHKTRHEVGFAVVGAFSPGSVDGITLFLANVHRLVAVGVGLGG